MRGTSRVYGIQKTFEDSLHVINRSLHIHLIVVCVKTEIFIHAPGVRYEGDVRFITADDEEVNEMLEKYLYLLKIRPTNAS